MATKELLSLISTMKKKKMEREVPLGILATTHGFFSHHPSKVYHLKNNINESCSFFKN
jgi:hypothetical protein